MQENRTGRKVTVVMELVVDEAAWCEEYGTDVGSVQRDVEDYILNLVTQSPAANARGFEVIGYALREEGA